MLPKRKSDRYSPSDLGLAEAKSISQSFQFMKRRDRLLDLCGRIREALHADRVRLYEYVGYGNSGPFFRGLVEVGGMYANLNKLELPLAADWYSARTLNHRRHGETILYPESKNDPAPPRYAPWAFWHNETPRQWVDILLMDRSRVVGKLSADNFRHPDTPLPDQTGGCRTLFGDLVRTMQREYDESNPLDMMEAHRRRILLNDLGDVLENMVATLARLSYLRNSRCCNPLPE